MNGHVDLHELGTLGDLKDELKQQLVGAKWLKFVEISTEDQQNVLRFVQDREAAKLLEPGTYKTLAYIDLQDVLKQHENGTDANLTNGTV